MAILSTAVLYVVYCSPLSRGVYSGNVGVCLWCWETVDRLASVISYSGTTGCHCLGKDRRGCLIQELRTFCQPVNWWTTSFDRIVHKIPVYQYPLTIGPLVRVLYESTEETRRIPQGLTRGSWLFQTIVACDYDWIQRHWGVCYCRIEMWRHYHEFQLYNNSAVIDSTYWTLPTHCYNGNVGCSRSNTAAM